MHDGNGCSLVQVGSRAGDYEVTVGRGVRGMAAAAVRRASPSGRCALVSDRTVAALWGGELAGALRAEGIDVVEASFPAGEAFKTRGTWAQLTDALMHAGLGRDCCVVALGGGVAGDVAGFVAATFMRGVPFVQLPTTTLAMIDASVGGKTGVNHPDGKNLVGAFHAPVAVLADPDFVATLDVDVRAQGYAEAVKHGAIRDAEYAEWLRLSARELLQGEAAAVERAVVRSVRIKARVVSEDEREAGPREVLNFGHTVAHALEREASYTLSHGHAVAIGMVAEARVGEALGVTAQGTADALEDVLAAFGLPTTHSALSRPRSLAERMTSDKKTRSGVVRMALLAELGRAEPGGRIATPVAQAELVRLLAEAGPGRLTAGAGRAKMASADPAGPHARPAHSKSTDTSLPHGA